MKRVGLALALATLWGCGFEGADGAGGFQELPRFQRACIQGHECPGRKCIQVGFNRQSLMGVCSAPCASDLDCGDSAGCFALGEAGPSCLSRCEKDADCEGGLACVVVGAGGERGCYVEAAE